MKHYFLLLLLIGLESPLDQYGTLSEQDEHLVGFP